MTTKTASSPGNATAPGDPASKKRTRQFAHKAFQICVIGHLYIGWRLLPDLPIGTTGMVAAGLFLVFTNLLVPYGTMARRFVEEPKMVDRLVWVGGLTMGWFSSLLILTIIRDLVLFVPSVAAWRADSAVTVIAITFAVTVIGFVNARRTAKVRWVNIAINKLPEPLKGFTIVQVTDIHVGSTIKGDYVQGIVNRVNSLNADLIAITGDVVDNTVEALKQHTAPLGKLRAHHGSYIVTGNHEYYSGAEEWIAEFRRLGLQPLLNDHIVIDHNGAQLTIAGINDYSAISRDPAETSAELHGSDPVKALNGSPEKAPKILLAHQPRSATAAAEAGFDLQLSGHTHGGQFWPWNLFIRMYQPYTAGLHRLGKLWIYISRGTGYWGPPKRFGAPSEITLIRLWPARTPHQGHRHGRTGRSG